MDDDTKFMIFLGCILIVPIVIGVFFEGYKETKKQDHQFQLDLEKAKAASPCTK
jgi:glucose uptake protein GlcU